jgi:hypothetical protein
MSLELVRRRTPIEAPADLDASERAQVENVLASEGVASIEAARQVGEWAGLELVDVLRGGALAYRLVLHPFGNGVLFEGTTTRPLLDVIQHHVEVRAGTEPALAEELVAAFQRDARALGITEVIASLRPAPTRAAPRLEEWLAEVEAKIASGTRLEDSEQDRLVGELARAVGGRRPDRPVAREELSPIARRLILVIADGGRLLHQLGELGLPIGAPGLRALAGPGQASGVHRTIEISGVSRSVLEHARAVASGQGDGDALVEAIVRLGEASATEILDRLLRFDPDERMTSFPWGESEAAAARWLTRLVVRMGAPGLERATALVGLEDAPGWLARAYVWALASPRVVSTPARVATGIRDLWHPERSSPQRRSDAALLLAKLLARLPDGPALVEAASTHTWYPPGEPVKGVHKGSGALRVDAAGLAAARGTSAPRLLEDVARLALRSQLLGPAGSRAGEAAASVLTDAGAAGLAAVTKVATEPELTPHAGAVLRKLGAPSAGTEPAPSKPKKKAPPKKRAR